MSEKRFKNMREVDDYLEKQIQNEKRFKLDWSKKVGTHFVLDTHTDERIDFYSDVVDLLNEQQATIKKLQEEKEYWESKAMTLLMQVRRLTSRMTDKEVEEFKKELEE